MKVETIKIVSKNAKGGFVVINKSDLKTTHTIFGEKVAPGKSEVKKVATTLKGKVFKK